MIKKFLKSKQSYNSIDYLLLINVIVLSFIGIIVVYSAYKLKTLFLWIFIGNTGLDINYA